MAKRVVVRGDEAEIVVELGEGPVPEEMVRRLPMRSKARTRDGAVHFPILIPNAAEPADRDELEVGEVAYWPERNALCLFFGPATNGTPRAAEDFTRVGKIVAGIEHCERIKPNDELRIEAAEG